MEGRDVRRAEEMLERDRAAHGVGGYGGGGGVGGGGRRYLTPCAEVASLHRRVGRCILLLSRFVSRSKEEENGSVTGGG